MAYFSKIKFKMDLSMNTSIFADTIVLIFSRGEALMGGEGGCPLEPLLKAACSRKN